MNKIKKIKLGDVLDVKRGTSLSGKYYSSSGNYIRLTLGNFRYPESGWKDNNSKNDLYFTGDFKKQFLLSAGDIITPLTEQVKGLLGNTATIPQNNMYIQSGDIGKVIPNENKINKRFAYYLVSSDLVKYQLSVGSQQTKIRHTTPEKIKSCYAFIPESIEVQEKISSLLDIINDKISCNNQIKTELDSILEALYVYWFLQYQFPNKEGKPYKSSGGNMVWNNVLKREIPEGWWSTNLNENDLCSVILNGVDKFDNKIYLATANIENEEIFIGKNITYENRESRANMQPRCHSVWFAKMKDSVKHIFIPENSEWFTSNYILSTGLYGLQCNEITFPYMSSYIQNKNFEIRKNALAHGSTQKAVSDGDLSAFKIVRPSNEILKKYAEFANPMYEMKFSIMKENQELSSLRDFLLPLLMNGQAYFRE